MPIQLSISEICEEIRHLRSAAADLLDPSADGVLAEFERSLRAVEWSELGHMTEWQLFREKPLKTKVSKGEFCFNGKTGGHNCYAKITSIWTIRPVKPAKKNGKILAFEVCGKASVHVEIYDHSEMKKEDALGSWRMELGDPSAPGCFFHTQILAEKDRSERPFPHSFDVPRIPNFLFTPMAVTEFVLGELFQEKWRSPQRQSRSALRAWAKIQRERLLRTFLWHIRQSQASIGSPWSHIKDSIPDPDWFVRPNIDITNPDSFLK